MKIEDQVLSIEQVLELQELGFDVIKNSSAIVIIKENGTFIVDKEIIEKNIFGITDKIEDLFYSMTIGDIIEVLPEKIIEEYYGGNVISFMEINKKSVCYSCYNKCAESDTMAFISTQENLIDSLFDCLVWCIKEKHIAL